MGSMTRLLILEDDEGLRTSLRMVLEDENYEVMEAADAEHALDVVGTPGVDLMLVVRATADRETVGRHRERRECRLVVADEAAAAVEDADDVDERAVGEQALERRRLDPLDAR